MAFPTAVNSQITDSVTEADKKPQGTNDSGQVVEEGIDTASAGKAESNSNIESESLDNDQPASTLGVTKLNTDNDEGSETE